MPEDKLDGIEMGASFVSPQWNWNHIWEFDLGTYNGEFVDGEIILDIVNRVGQKLKVKIYMQDVEVLEVYHKPSPREELETLLEDVHGKLESLADGAVDSGAVDESERFWAKLRDDAWSAVQIARKLTEHGLHRGRLGRSLQEQQRMGDQNVRRNMAARKQQQVEGDQD